ncbi:MAG: hypothetical protein WA087_01850 [Candidatus Saccharimonadales bacterium]
MAKIIKSDVDSQLFSAFYPFWRIAIVGLVIGLVFWGTAELIDGYTDSISLAGNIATIISSIIAVAAMVRLQIAQPLIIAVLAGAALWGLAEWTDGLFWIEAIAWSAVIYTLSYVCFSWLLRFKNSLSILVGALIVLVAIRVVITL